MSQRVTELAAWELAAGLETLAPYAAFGKRVAETKRKLLEFLIAAKRDGASIAGYGAPARATPCSITAGSAPTSSTTPSTATPTSTAASRPAPTSRSTRRSGWPRRGPTTS